VLLRANLGFIAFSYFLFSFCSASSWSALLLSKVVSFGYLWFDCGSSVSVTYPLTLDATGLSLNLASFIFIAYI